MENTIENKIAFIAQYWGQIVGQVKEFGLENIFKVRETVIYDIDYLSLKPLSKITDEDALQCAKIYYGIDRYELIEKNKIRYISNVKKYIIRNPDLANLEVTDYLRSKGYALPYMGLSVEQQIEYGWIKLKED